MAALAGTPLPAAKAAPVPDQVPELRGAYRPPAPVVPDDAFLSWEQGPADRGREAPAPEPEESAPVRPRVDVEVSFGAPPKAAAGQLRADAAVSPAAVAPQPPADVATSGAVETAAVALGEDATALLHAFLKGLGMPDLALPHGLTPEAMETIGRLLREATAGTLALLLARAVTKREVRAEVTMIVSRDNNPLKFSPDVEAALAHLLAPRGKGFLPPVEAMRDAYDDLRSHELGFMAGMRAALAGVLHRFDPAVLEQRLSGKSMLDSLLPMNRRARLWDLYTELFREIASEAEDDFHALFGREFLRAYEEQVERLKERDA
ncbi:MAG: type VI secretion system-associated FHA domain protein TagH [Betaproteobacteria bacterium]|nr:MAG: type VI secretion system-associated FHA domain protein TagH [Betaproteobacteria bacterium]